MEARRELDRLVGLLEAAQERELEAHREVDRAHRRELVVGLDVTHKEVRVANYHRETMKTAGELIGAMGLKQSGDLRPWHLMRRTALAEIHHYGEVYEFIEEGSLLGKTVPASFARPLEAARADSFSSAFPDAVESNATHVAIGSCQFSKGPSAGRHLVGVVQGNLVQGKKR